MMALSYGKVHESAARLALAEQMIKVRHILALSPLPLLPPSPPPLLPLPLFLSLPPENEINITKATIYVLCSIYTL